MPKKYTIESVRAFVSENSESTLLSQTYENCNTKLRFRCSCGAEFETDFAHFKNQNQRRCPVCAMEFRQKRFRLTLDEVNERLRSIGCEYVSGDYVSRKSLITIKCSCGHLKTMRLNTALTNHYSGLCDACASKRFRGANRLSVKDVSELCAARGLELLSTEYRNARTPIRVRCSCGREFITSWDSIHTMSKTRCDVCSGQMSRGEHRIEVWLKQHGIAYERQKRFPHCGGGTHAYRFDFYLPHENVCIEFDGQQHFKVVNFSGKSSDDELRAILFDTQCRDLVKDMYCSEHGIELIRIRYDEEDQISDILDSKLIPR